MTKAQEVIAKYLDEIDLDDPDVHASNILFRLHKASLAAQADAPGGQPQSPSLPVAWVAFADNGNVRFWTSDPHRSQREKERGLDLRAFTMAELIALISRIPAPSAALSDTSQLHNTQGNSNEG